MGHLDLSASLWELGPAIEAEVKYFILDASVWLAVMLSPRELTFPQALVHGGIFAVR